MRALRLRLPLKVLLAVEVAVLVAGLVGGAFAALNQTQRATFELQSRASCPAAQVRVAPACVDKREVDASWTIGSGNTEWGRAQQRASYSWNVPPTIPSAGATLTLRVGAQELTGDSSSRICPRMRVLGFELAGGARELGGCADGGSSTTASRTVRLLPTRSAPGTTVYLTVELQDGPSFSYAYRAVTGR